ncbi:MAG TPA: phosphotransferase [Thermoanaerobaculia bacterium]|nr:phosphotransferase [Thermoanaerobaculia bacterium]
MTNDYLPEDAVTFLTDFVGKEWTVRKLKGDASVRRYYRVFLPGGDTRMLAWYPTEVRSQLQQFVKAYDAVIPYGPIPEVIAYSKASVLQRDVGDRTLYDLLHDDRQEGIRLYRDAVKALVEFQQATADINPPFTADFFFNELEMTRRFYVEKLMGVAPERSEELVPLFRKLAETIARHPYVLCHRDYHGQNIHVFNGSLYVIDYQDLRMGPDTYDLASLLRDRGVARLLGDDKEIELVGYYSELRDDASLRGRYFQTLLQRSLKILGTFSKQPIERGKLHYLEFIPATIESVDRCLRELPEMAGLRRTFPLEFDLDAATARVKGMMGE